MIRRPPRSTQSRSSAASDVYKRQAGWDAELDGLSGSGAGHLVDLGEFGAGSGEADLEAFDFAEPSFAAGFFDSGEQVVADIEEALALGWVGAQQGAAQAGFSELTV